MDSYLKVEKRESGYVVLSIGREPVNSMNLDLWRQLSDQLDQLEKNSSVRGLIFRSGLQKDIFTAGNDIMELYAPKTSAERYQDFWVTQNSFFARLYRSRLVTVAAIRGACPAGGCALALCCDYRVMTDFGNIGLNEVALGIPVPAYWAQLMLRTVGQRIAEKLLPYGLLATADEALRYGLVDQLSPAAQLDKTAEDVMGQMLKAPDGARHATKSHLRKSFSDEWQDFAPKEAEQAWGMLNHPKTIASLEGVLARLSKGKKD